MRKLGFIGILGLMLGMFALNSTVISPRLQEISVANLEFNLPDFGLWEQERNDGGYYTILDGENNILDKTIRTVYPEDEFIASNNRHYRVEKVEGDFAYASLVTEEALSDFNFDSFDEIMPVFKEKKNNIIALYHTHTAESYVPSDGSESIPGKGGIYKVGEKLAEKLKEKKVKVEYDKTPHDPHDADAYRRSRRTAVELMKKQPAAIIDIHRDGVPDPDFYYTNVAGMDVTKVRLVVGRQNQNMQSNLDFAKQLKSQLDKFYPGLVHGIFMAKGNYNQDLSPRSLLIEVGTHTNKREIAEKGAILFADGIPAVLGITTPKTANQTTLFNTTKGDNKSIWWIIGAVVIGIIAFLLLSTGSIKGSISKLKQFSSEEWSNFLGTQVKKETILNKEKETEKEE